MDTDQHWMRQALNLAAKGEGRVEPNPMVGCVLVRNDQCLGQGYHTAFGKAHAEVEALNQAQHLGHSCQGATAYVTLEPCSHFGKTPPCAQALIQAGIKRVVIAIQDPFVQVAGQGIRQLQDAGMEVTVGVLQDEATFLLAPYLTRIQKQRPWLIGKWAMTLDGKMATSNGNSRWISSQAARDWVHQLRGRLDGILIGIGTALADDPMLTVRPPGIRNPARLILDRQLRLPADSQLAKTATQFPTWVATTTQVPTERKRELQNLGVQLWEGQWDEDARDPYTQWIRGFLNHLAESGMTNILVEGGASVLGHFFDQKWIDEVAVFVAPKIIGGNGPSPVGGQGLAMMDQASPLTHLSHQVLGPDVLIRGRTGFA